MWLDDQGRPHVTVPVKNATEQPLVVRPGQALGIAAFTQPEVTTQEVMEEEDRLRKQWEERSSQDRPLLAKAPLADAGYDGLPEDHAQHAKSGMATVASIADDDQDYVQWKASERGQLLYSLIRASADEMEKSMVMKLL